MEYIDVLVLCYLLCAIASLLSYFPVSDTIDPQKVHRMNYDRTLNGICSRICIGENIMFDIYIGNGFLISIQVNGQYNTELLNIANTNHSVVSYIGPFGSTIVQIDLASFSSPILKTASVVYLFIFSCQSQFIFSPRVKSRPLALSTGYYLKREKKIKIILDDLALVE